MLDGFLRHLLFGQRLDDAVDSAARASSSSASASTLSPAPSDDTASSEHKDSATR